MHKYFYLIEHKPYNIEGWKEALKLVIDTIGIDEFDKYSYKRKCKELQLSYLAGLLIRLAEHNLATRSKQDQDTDPKEILDKDEQVKIDSKLQDILNHPPI